MEKIKAHLTEPRGPRCLVEAQAEEYDINL